MKYYWASIEWAHNHRHELILMSIAFMFFVTLYRLGATE